MECYFQQVVCRQQQTKYIFIQGAATTVRLESNIPIAHSRQLSQIILLIMRMNVNIILFRSQQKDDYPNLSLLQMEVVD